MKENTIVLLTAEIITGILAGIAAYLGNWELAGVGVGAVAGMLGGHLNGTAK